MKSLIKNKKIFIIVYPICLGFSWLVFSLPALAAAYKLEFPLPGLPQTVTDPGEYIRYFFLFGLGLVGFLAVAAIVVGGIMYMTGSTVGKVDRAKQIIWGAVTGLVLLLCSYLLLFLLDPTLVKLSPLDLSKYNTSINQLGKPYQGATQCPSSNPIYYNGQCLTQQQYQQALVQQYAPTSTQCNTVGQCTEAQCAPANQQTGVRSCIPTLEVWNTGQIVNQPTCRCATLSIP